MSTTDLPGDDEIGAKVRAHRGLCEGWGECRRWAPSVFHLDEEGLIDIHVLAVPAGLAREAMIGASACPEQAISYDGPRTFPQDNHHRRGGNDAGDAFAGDHGEGELP